MVFGARGGTLYLMDLRADRSSFVVRLPGQNLDSVDDIKWSPDSAHLAIMNDLEPGGGRLYVMNADGSGIRVILDNYESGGLAWSPNGKVLAYATQGGGQPDRLWTVSSDKGRPFNVVASGRIRGPVWSPDGSHIAFVGSRRGGRAWYAVDADGGGSPLQIDELTYLNWRRQSQD
jgi:Tol biopolymer transport system component